MADYVGGDMIRGHIDTIILSSLIDGDKDTNQIREEIEERAAGRFQLKQGTFYSALQRISRQGLVNEYRTTGPDGVRRKFFQLTEKGKAHIEETQNSWTMSRQVINSLIDAPQPEDEQQSKVVLQEDNIPDFHTEEKIVSSFAELDATADQDNKSEADILVFGDQEQPEPEIALEDVVLSEIENSENDIAENEDASKTEQASPTFDEFLDIMARVNADAELQIERELESNKQGFESENIHEEIILDKSAEDNSAEKEETVFTNSEFIPDTNDFIDNTIEDTVDNVIPFNNAVNENNNEIDEDVINQSFMDILEFSSNEDEENPHFVADFSYNSDDDIESSDDLLNVEDESSIEQHGIEIETHNSDVQQPEIKIEQPEIDDFLDSSDVPQTMDYKEVLSKIFAKSNSEKHTESSAISENNAQQDQQSVLENYDLPAEDNYDVLVDELDFTNKDEEIAEREHDLQDHRRSKRFRQPNSKGGIDYSDIIALSQEEGFKVTTSDRTNKNELGKILINKVNFHNSLIFYLLIAIETLIVGLTMESVLKFGIEAYIIFASVLLVLPLISGILYYMDPKHKIAEVGSFKSSFETALIITLNLILLTLAIAILLNIDFSSPQEITRAIFIPILVIINIPLYIIIRHSLLQKQMYYS